MPKHLKDFQSRFVCVVKFSIANQSFVNSLGLTEAFQPLQGDPEIMTFKVVASSPIREVLASPQSQPDGVRLPLSVDAFGLLNDSQL
ncbi:hypothetical protein D918_03607 [Trichuris suis]|nr:hypothetical protein D918_03607 [Trichuris suis]